jgi:phosphoglycolate phosphatase-like HAD superfamily hydrolase
VICQNSYSTEEVVLIGDSWNDLEAASKNEIKFMGYNNPELNRQGIIYLKDFSNG